MAKAANNVDFRLLKRRSPPQGNSSKNSVMRSRQLYVNVRRKDVNALALFQRCNDQQDLRLLEVLKKEKSY